LATALPKNRGRLSDLPPLPLAAQAGRGGCFPPAASLLISRFPGTIHAAGELSRCPQNNKNSIFAAVSKPGCQSTALLCPDSSGCQGLFSRAAAFCSQAGRAHRVSSQNKKQNHRGMNLAWN
jgi:hypothetical protein